MNSSSSSLTSGLGKAGMLAVAALVALAGMFAFANSAQAAPQPFSMTVDNGKMNLGVLFVNKTVIPAEIPGPLGPAMPNTSVNGLIEGEVDGTTATVDAADFKMPIFGVPNPTNPSQTVPIQLQVPAGLTGTWDSASGKLELTGAMAINVITGANGMGAEVCSIQVPSVKWSTDLNKVTPGVPFAAGAIPAGTGAISAAWDDLPNGVEVNGGDCSTVNTIIHDKGSMWLSNGIATPPPAPKCESPLVGTWPACEEPQQCPTGQTGTPPNCVTPVANLNKIVMTPKSAKGKAGKKITLTIKVTNSGNASGTATVNIKASNKRVSVQKKLSVTVAAGKTVTKKIKATIKGKAKGKSVITAKLGSKSAKTTITIQKKK